MVGQTIVTGYNPSPEMNEDVYGAQTEGRERI